MKTREIREICGDYALELELSHGGAFTMYFNSRQNALTVKRIIDVDNSVPNSATVCEMEEVRHGKWEAVIGTRNSPKWGNNRVACSECRRSGYTRYTYCPNCGAKMDGKGEGE